MTPWAPRVKHEAEAPDLRPTIQDDLPPSPRTIITAATASRKSIRKRWAGRRTNRPLLPRPPLMSPETINAANSSFNQLADTLMARALGERSIEDMTQDLLKGMLRSWLDAHLPSLVEKLVREEIERVARRGR